MDNPPLHQDEKEKFSAWDNLDLLSMAKKRDGLPSFGSSSVANQKLELFYAPIYGQFSSVSHSDMYSVALLELHKNPAGQRVLSPDPHWPATLACFNALFDIIQCFECATGVYGRQCEANFESLFARWHEVMTRSVSP